MRTTRHVPFISSLICAVALPAITPVQAAVNSWTRAGGSAWEDNAAWSLGRCPSNGLDNVFITNATTKTVDIDDQTATKVAYSMTIQELTLSAPAGATNTLWLHDAGLAAPLSTYNVKVLSGGFLNITNSALTGNDSHSLIVDGNCAMNNSLLEHIYLAVGQSGNGQMTANGSTANIQYVWIGGGTGTVGTVAFNNGTWNSGGIDIGNSGNGQMRWSNVTATIGYTTLLASDPASRGTLILSGTNSISASYSLYLGGYTDSTNRPPMLGAVGTLAVSGGVTTVNGGPTILVGNLQGSTGLVTLSQAELIMGGSHLLAGCSGVGQVTVASNSTLDVSTVTVGGGGGTDTMTVSGGSALIADYFGVGDSGTLIINNSTVAAVGQSSWIGADGTGVVSLANSSMETHGLELGNSGSGTLTLSNSTLVVGDGGVLMGNGTSGARGTIQAIVSTLICTNGLLGIGYDEAGSYQVTASNCVMIWGEEIVGNVSGSAGSLTLVGGTNSIAGDLLIGHSAGSTGRVTVTGGRLEVTNGISLGGAGKATLVISNSTVQAASLQVSSPAGTLTFESGTVTVNAFVAANGTKEAVTFNGGTLNTKASTVDIGAGFNVGNGTRAAALNLQGGTHSFADGLEIAAQAQLRGTGTVVGAVSSSGTVSPGASAGTLAFGSNYTQNASGVLNIELSSAGSYDVLGVGGTAQLGGTLNVTNHYSPAPGDTFTFLTAANRVGTFAATNLPSPGVGSKWVLTYTPSAVILSLQTTLPVVTITNSNASVAYETTAYTIGGTNNANVVGTMRWTNTLTGVSSTFAATSPWFISDIALNVGTNAIFVTGTNVDGAVSTDSVQIIRLPVGSGTPVVDVLTENATAGYIATAFAIRGTNNLHVVGTMRWTNSLTGGNGTLAAASSWAVQGIGLGVGTNVLTVSGTNAAGATASGAVTVIRLPAGPPTAGYGKALDFDGTNDFVLAPAMNWAPAEFTVEWWMNPHTRKNFNQSLSAGAGWGAFAFHTTTNGGIYVGTDGSDAHRMTPVELPAGTLETNTWQHFAFTFVGGTGRFYKGGTLVATKSGMSNSVAWGGFYVSSASAASAIDGQVDEVRIWKTALPQATISNWMYRALDLTHPASDNLKAYYKFNEGSNAVAHDAMGAYDGTLSNMNTGICWVDSTVRDWRTWVNHALDGSLIGSYEGGTSTDGTNGNLSFQIVGQGTVGTVQTAAAHGFRFTPSPNQIGTNIFTYYVITTNSLTSTVATASVVVPSDYDEDGIPDPWEAVYYGGVTNANLDAMASNNVNTVREAYIADLNPTNPASLFRIVAATNGPPLRVFFLSSSNRLYALNRNTNLVSGVWTNVPGQGPRVGAGGPDWLQDTNAVPAGFYRLDVRLP